MPVYKYINAEQTLVAVIHDNGLSLGAGAAMDLVPEGAFVEPYSGIPEEVNPQLLAQIAAVEASITQRRLRDAVLTESGAAWLAEKDAQIEMLRQQLI